MMTGINIDNEISGYDKITAQRQALYSHYEQTFDLRQPGAVQVYYAICQ